MTPPRQPACMGGWCRIRDRCGHYNASDRTRPIERLCEPNQDGEAVQLVRWKKAGEWQSEMDPRAAGAAA